MHTHTHTRAHTQTQNTESGKAERLQNSSARYEIIKNTETLMELCDRSVFAEKTIQSTKYQIPVRYFPQQLAAPQIIVLISLNFQFIYIWQWMPYFTLKFNQQIIYIIKPSHKLFIFKFVLSSRPIGKVIDCSILIPKLIAAPPYHP